MVTHPPSPTQDPLAETYGKDCDLLKKWLTRFKRREKKGEKHFGATHLISMYGCLRCHLESVCIATSHFSLSIYTRDHKEGSFLVKMEDNPYINWIYIRDDFFNTQ